MAYTGGTRIKETSTTTGTGTYTLAGAATGFQSFADIGDGNTCHYVAEDGTDWEVGVGTYTAAGTTLARTTVIASSNSDAAVNWAAGTRNIFCAMPGEKAVTTDQAQTISNKTFDDISLSAPTELTISGGAITVTQTHHKIDTESDAASDDLATINGNSDVTFLVLRPENGARTVVIKDGSGNIETTDGLDIDLDAANKFALCFWNPANLTWTAASMISSTAKGFLALTDSATIDLDVSTYDRFQVEIAGDRTITFSNATLGDTFEFAVKQDGTGGWSLTWPSTVIWESATAPSTNIASGTYDWISFFCVETGPSVFLGIHQNPSGPIN